MFCCVCAGSCNHVGAHSYCGAHGGSPYQPMAQPLNATNVTTFGYYPCEHCYCETAPDGAGTGPHRLCCKCKTRMAEEFIAALSASTHDNEEPEDTGDWERRG